MQVMKVDHPVNQIGIYILCIVICLPTVFAPYLSGSLLLILICFHYGYKAECAASLLLFIYAVSKYYYDLNLSLLTKSMTLFFIGIACITAWYFLHSKKNKTWKSIAEYWLLQTWYCYWDISTGRFIKKRQTLKDGQLILFTASSRRLPALLCKETIWGLATKKLHQIC